MRMVYCNDAWHHGGRAALAMYLAIAVGVCGLFTGITGSRCDDAFLTSVSVSVGVLLGECPKWFPWCMV